MSQTVTVDGRTIVLTAEEIEAGDLKDLHVTDVARLKLAYEAMVKANVPHDMIVAKLAPAFNEIEEVMTNPAKAFRNAKTRAEIILAALRFGPLPEIQS